MMRAGRVDVAVRVGATPQRHAATLENGRAEVDEQDAGDGRGCCEYQSLRSAALDHGVA